MLHVRSVKKAVNIAFYSPGQRIGFFRRLALALPAAGIARPPKPGRRPALFPSDSIQNKN
jgi:hypothetical protein